MPTFLLPKFGLSLSFCPSPFWSQFYSPISVTVLWTELLQITKGKIAKPNNISRDGSFPAQAQHRFLRSPERRLKGPAYSRAHENGHSEMPCQSSCWELRNSFSTSVHLYICRKIQHRLVLQIKQAASSAATLAPIPNQKSLRVIFEYRPASFLLRHLPFHVVLLQQAASTGEKPFH